MPTPRTMSNDKGNPASTSTAVVENPSSNLHYARRGSAVDDDTVASDIEGYDAERMRARTLLTVEEEKKLLRKIDLRLMTLCSIMFLLKNIDADNVSNARIMNKGQPSNIMKELGMTSNEYNLVTTMYYVSGTTAVEDSSTYMKHLDTIHRGRGTFKPASQAPAPIAMAVADHGDLGYVL
jgi:hypothetical protein